ncbi:Transcription factor WER [Tritrichomonas foetus]|uniref:Transcription factor WER n=1 Tax=Tritrichomonas foetus TaxID=1144522 RepID=A0A1J4JC13_9EUKA|nr:Transcription factor WER [Tritrichomonas foetus]|eukprot:OHS96680.1 Transcription factor WER [Tritrichomonas foetus]
MNIIFNGLSTLIRIKFHIIEILSRRTSNQMHSLGLKIKKNAFTVEDDMKLKKLVEKYGEHRWAFVASKMKNRNTRQCRERWINYLSPLAVNGKWTDEEDEHLREKVHTIGRKWKLISKSFPGRTDINIRNRWKYLTKHNMTELSYNILYSNKNGLSNDTKTIHHMENLDNIENVIELDDQQLQALINTIAYDATVEMSYFTDVDCFYS